jgi:hypothetical protein
MFLERDEGISFLGIAGNGDAADGKFDSQLRFDGCGDNGVVAEDLLGLVGVGGHAADADAGVSIVREFGTAKAERIGRLSEDGGNGKSMNVGLSKSENQTKFGQRLRDAKELEIVPVDGAEFFGGVFEGEGKDRDFGAFDVLREVGIGAFGTDGAFFAGDDLSGILDPIEHAVTHLLHNIVDSDRSAGIPETATPRRALKSTLKFFEVFEVFVVRFQNQTAKTSKTSKKQKNERVQICSELDGRIDFAELPDKIADRELGESAHLKAPWVSREDLRQSKTLSGNPFLFSCHFHQQPHRVSFPFHGSGSSSSSRSMR